jgi:hypothetical protein
MLSLKLLLSLTSTTTSVIDNTIEYNYYECMTQCVFVARRHYLLIYYNSHHN